MNFQENKAETKQKRPITWIPTAYFAMGLPFVVLNMVTVLMFKGLGVDNKLITFWTSLIMLPWTLKPLWSPFLELFKTKKFFVIWTNPGLKKLTKPVYRKQQTRLQENGRMMSGPLTLRIFKWCSL